jgi:actin
MFKGLPARLKSEIDRLGFAGGEINIIAPPERANLVWKGAAMMANLSTFASAWVTAEDYQEHGAAVVHRKC